MNKFQGIFHFLLGLAVISCLTSCASINSIQPQVDQLARNGQFDKALKILDQPQKYGSQNELLRLLDQGMVLHLAGRYQESIDVFTKARERYDELYTESLTRIAESWLWNDYAMPYRGEDYERVMINVIQALNYAALGNIKDALVEARDVDSMLNVINDQYPKDKRNVYRSDAFARFLMGVLYEADHNLNDALVSYRLSFESYTEDYEHRYATRAPEVLKQNLLAAAEAFQSQDLVEIKKAVGNIPYVSVEDKENSAEVYLVEYQGQSPVKQPISIPLPLPDGNITQFSFVRYEPMLGKGVPSRFDAVDTSLSIRRWDKTQLAENIEAIAIKSLDDRKMRVIAKAILRPAGKYLIEKTLERNVSQEHGEGTGNVIKVLSGLYNIISERPDLRCWQTLPAQIRIGRIILKPGAYQMMANDQVLGTVQLQKGQKYFYMIRTRLGKSIAFGD